MLVVSGPSGVGKGTVVAALLRRRPDAVLSVSATTRAPRSGEVPGRHYHFLSTEQFQALVDDGAFLEHAEFAGHRYGTPWSSVSDALDRGCLVVLEIDVQGALQVRRAFPDALLVFLRPPSLAALESRLRGRGTDDEDRIARRLALAREEMRQAAAFDHVVLNDRLEDAVDEIDRIVG